MCCRPSNGRAQLLRAQPTRFHRDRLLEAEAAFQAAFQVEARALRSNHANLYDSLTPCLSQHSHYLGAREVQAHRDLLLCEVIFIVHLRDLNQLTLLNIE